MNRDVVVRHRTAQHQLGPGDRLTVGRADAPDAPTPHLGLSPSSALHSRAGCLTADADGCTLTDTGRWLRLRVLHVGGTERSDLDPGRSLRLPWTHNRIEVATGPETLAFEVELPQRPTAAAPPLPAGDTVGGLGLDRSTGYFRALVALCEPRLRDPGGDAVAGVGEIARRLTASGRESGRVSPKAVERRLANVRQRLGLGAEVAFGGSGAGLEVRDAARRLVDLALRTGTVVPADLTLLEASDATSAGGASPSSLSPTPPRR